MNFADLGLADPILKAVDKQGYTTPSPIQAQAIPPVLAGRDVMAAAQTGTGKTAGFTLPLLHRLSQSTAKPGKQDKQRRGNAVRALVLTPTRELAAQVAESISVYGQNLSLKSDVVFGGVKINPQMQRLRGGADILVATPGRLLDLHSQNAIHFNELEVLILDEADRMLDMGFIHDIKKIIKLLPEQRQNLLFSATFSEEIRQLAKRIVHDPVEVSVTPPNSTAKTVKQWLVPVDKAQKTNVLIALINENDWQQVLVFSRTKHGANKLVRKLEDAGINAAPIHGNKSQGARTKALAGFKSGDIRVLVATDIAARGIDIDQLPQVVNFDLPNVSEDYVHRIGRTGRAGAEGQAVSLVSADEADNLFGIERLIQQLIERRYHEDFYPSHEVPESKLDSRPIKTKKPKKPKQTNPRRDKADQAHDQDSAKKASTNRNRRQRNGGNNHNKNSDQQDAKRRDNRQRSNNKSNKPRSGKTSRVIDDNIGNTIERDTNQNRDVIRDPYENSHDDGTGRKSNRSNSSRSRRQRASGPNSATSQDKRGNTSSNNRSSTGNRNNSKSNKRKPTASNTNRPDQNSGRRSGQAQRSRRKLPRDEFGDVDGNR